jgi:hypothetical protein
MHTALANLIDRLDKSELSEADVIPWGAPVPSFGDLSRARVATLGLNPSNREFISDTGDELGGVHRRFHTLSSLGLHSWSDVNAYHLRLILDSCRTYFFVNPYDRWFRKLDYIISGTGASYYDLGNSACHLDLIPYATARKWTSLTSRQRTILLSVAGDSLALLLRDSSIRLLVLNGKTVIDHFQRVTGVRMEQFGVSEWTLRRDLPSEVSGFGYRAYVTSLCGVSLTRGMLVLGYNHNIQSSFGVTNSAMAAIRDWIAQAVGEGFLEAEGHRTRSTN